MPHDKVMHNSAIKKYYQSFGYKFSERDALDGSKILLIDMSSIYNFEASSLTASALSTTSTPSRQVPFIAPRRWRLDARGQLRDPLRPRVLEAVEFCHFFSKLGADLDLQEHLGDSLVNVYCGIYRPDLDAFEITPACLAQSIFWICRTQDSRPRNIASHYDCSSDPLGDLANKLLDWAVQEEEEHRENFVEFRDYCQRMQPYKQKVIMLAQLLERAQANFRIDYESDPYSYTIIQNNGNLVANRQLYNSVGEKTLFDCLGYTLELPKKE